MPVVLGAALLGGVCLVANLFVGAAALSGVGLVLLAVAVAAIGASLVRATWLMAITASGAVALGWAVLEVLRDVAPDRQVEALVGGCATLYVAVAVLRAPRGGSRTTRRGNHRS